ncbi:putative polysaccharide biosynthesis protein [Brochothrix thermosphacta]|uniref:polysaccharide biosynthesis C-terminal domain-containing protein n=1 Tax=Brochothrix thermosphacta TaxID=2756 RepID=UPI000D77718C|nr:polysaccharide biosynthesis C-terminal domain-containing protein [Brochothrix thermosphacta]SPN71249.1 putative polysaccharide biosynthesis protein [Brochothrix thermosphacta]
MSKRINRLLSNPYGATILKKGIVIMTGLLSMILLTRFLGPELKGQYSYYFNIVTIGTTILNLGISLVYPEYKRKDKDYRNVFLSLSFLQFFIYLIVSLSFWYLSDSNNYGMVAILVSVGILNLQLSQINLVENIKSHSIVISVGAISNLVFTLIIYLFFKNSVSIALILLLLKNAILIGGSIYVLKNNFHLEGSAKIFKTVVIAGFLPMLTTVLVSINYRIDILLLNVMDVPFYDIGLYSTGVQLAEYAWMIPDIFKEVMMHKNARKDDLKHLFFSIRMANTGVIMFILVVVLFGKQILQLLFGSEFMGAYEITVLMFLAVPFMVYAKIIGTLFIANGKWNFYFGTLFLAVVFNIGLNFAFVPLWGTIGSAFASVVSYALSGVIFLCWLLKHTQVKWHELIIVRGYDIKQIYRKIKS